MRAFVSFRMTARRVASISSCLVLLVLSCLVPSDRVHAFCFDEASKVSGIGVNLLRSIAQVESGMKPTAVNRNKNGSTDLGLMQINSSWIGPLGLDRNKLMTDPCYNVMTGAAILRKCIDKQGYNWEAVGCYNAYSRNKRVHYSWKIYRQIKKEGEQHQAVPPSGKAAQGTGNKKQSLHFKVIDDKSGDTEEP